MDEFVDIYGDDDDLLSESTDSNDSRETMLCTDPSHEHFDDASLPDDIKALIKIFPITSLSQMLTDTASRERAVEEEQIAIITTLISLVGKEKFDSILRASEHYRRFKTWNSVAMVFEEVLGSNVISSFEDDEGDNSTVMTVLRAHLETASSIASHNRDLHRKVLDAEHSDFDESLIEGLYSFHAWQRSSNRFLTELKASVGTILEGLNKAFEKKSGRVTVV